MAKYKFRLSYYDNGVLTPIKLECLEEIKGIDITDIKEIDKFTTKYENKENLLSDLKEKKLLPEFVNQLFITFDKKDDKNTIQQLYSFNKTIFYSDDTEKLKTSYAYTLIRNHINDGEFMNKIIKFFQGKYPNKDFSAIEGVSYDIKRYGTSYLTPSEYKEYVDGIEYFMNYIFNTKDKEGKYQKDYKKLRGFLCFLKGETPIQIIQKKIKQEKEVINELYEEKEIDEYDFEEFITYDEYRKFNIDLISNTKEENFEPYQDGVDFIAPTSKREKFYALDDYTKKLVRRKDNGEYE